MNTTIYKQRGKIKLRRLHKIRMQYLRLFKIIIQVGVNTTEKLIIMTKILKLTLTVAFIKGQEYHCKIIVNNNVT